MSSGDDDYKLFNMSYGVGADTLFNTSSSFSTQFLGKDRTAKELLEICSAEYELTEHRHNKRNDIKNVCVYCKVKHAFLNSSDCFLFFNDLLLCPSIEKKEIKKLLKHIYNTCECYINPSKETLNVSNKKCIELFEIFNEIMNGKLRINKNENFFVETLKHIKLSQYQKTFNDKNIKSFYDLKFKQDLKSYLKDEIGMKTGHIARFVRKYNILFLV